MANLYDVLDSIIKNDTDAAEVEQQAEVTEEPTAEEDARQEPEDQDSGYDNGGGFEGAVSNSIGRGAVENLIKNTVYSPEKILSKSFFDKHPDIFYDFYYNYFLNTTAEPNRAHKALAELEKMGKLKAVVTQNIDGLHQKAGSRTVHELHGSVYRHYCPICKTEMTYEDVKTLKGSVPKCPKCDAVVRPYVVLYEENLPEKVVRSAVEAILSADLLIIGGTSLAVYPAANYIRYFKGQNIVLINREPTAFDYKASLIFRESIGEVLQTAVESI